MDFQQESENPPVPTEGDQSLQPLRPTSPPPNDPRTSEGEQPHSGHFNTLLPRLAQGRAPEGYEVFSPAPQEESNDAPPSNPQATETSGQNTQPTNTASDPSSPASPQTSQAEPQTVSDAPTLAGPSTTTSTDPVDRPVIGDDEQPVQPSTPPMNTPTTDPPSPSITAQAVPEPSQLLWNLPFLAHLWIEHRARILALYLTRPNASPAERRSWNHPYLARIHPTARAMFLTMISHDPRADPPNHPSWNQPSLAHYAPYWRAMYLAWTMHITLEQREYDENLRRNAAEQRHASWPVRYNDVYDKLTDSTDSWPKDELTRPQFQRREFVCMTDRVLLQARQARAAARLDTTAMDEEIQRRFGKQVRTWGSQNYDSDSEAPDTESGDAGEGEGRSWGPGYESQTTRRGHLRIDVGERVTGVPEPVYGFQTERRRHESMVVQPVPSGSELYSFNWFTSMNDAGVLGAYW